jgi:multimeric flavodoxin WrbA
LNDVIKPGPWEVAEAAVHFTHRASARPAHCLNTLFQEIRMPNIVVVFHSGYGHTQRMAQAVAEGAGARLAPIGADGSLSAEDWAALDAADAIIMGSPTYMGSVSWQFKKFADDSSKAWFVQKWKDKLFAGFTNSATMNGDKHSTLHYLFTLAQQHSGLWVGTGMMPSNSKAATRNDPNYVGSFAGAMATSPSDASPAEMLPGDLETAKRFGARVAATAARLAPAKG